MDNVIELKAVSGTDDASQAEAGSAFQDNVPAPTPALVASLRFVGSLVWEMYVIQAQTLQNPVIMGFPAHRIGDGSVRFDQNRPTFLFRHALAALEMNPDLRIVE